MTESKFIFLFLLIIFSGCHENHIAKNNIQVDTLLTLPDGFYAHRRGSVYHTPLEKTYTIWYSQTPSAEIANIFRIDDLNNLNADKITTIKKHGIDTIYDKSLVQNFKKLSRKYHFGHIFVDKKNLVSFSAIDGMAEQYVMPLNDSVRKEYHNKKDFVIEETGWFRYIGK